MASSILIAVVAFFASGLTLFSGFGLGTILMPAFALFFPLTVAIALTAIVHLLNNLFKLVLLGRHADLKVSLLFGVPAIIASLTGAKILLLLQKMPPLDHYQLGGHSFVVLPGNLVIAILISLFVVLEFGPFKYVTFDRRRLALGGVLSGFFGGLSGHQGALRSAFLIKCGLNQEAFIATGVVIACLVDLSRLLVYCSYFSSRIIGANAGILGLATVFAFAGAFIGNRLLKKITMPVVQTIVAVMLIVIALFLGAGLI